MPTSDIHEFQRIFSGGAKNTLSSELLNDTQYVDASNVEIRDAECRSRRGSFRLFTDVTGEDFQGAGLFKPANESLPPEQIMVAQGDKLKRLIRTGERIDLTLPDALKTDKFVFVQALSDIYIFRGKSYPVWRWDGDIDNDIEILEVPDAPFIQMPESDRVLYEYNRFWVITERDTVNVSDILTEVFDPNNAININKGKDGEKLLRLFPLSGGGLLAFKERSIALIGNANVANLTLTNLTLDFIDNEFGIIGTDAVVAVGKDVWFFTHRGLMSIILSQEQKNQLVSVPISGDIEDTINRIDFVAAEDTQMTVFENYVLAAVPIDGSNTNNAILAYDLIARAFVPIWTGHNVRKFIKVTDDGRDRLFYVNDLGGITELLTGLYKDFEHSERRALEFRDSSSSQFVDLTSALSGTDKIDTQATGGILMEVFIDSLDDGSIFICTEPIGPDNLRIYIESGVLKAEIEMVVGVRWNLSTTAAPPVGKFFDIFLEQDGTEPVFYINGEKVAQTFTSSPVLDKTIWFVDITGGAPATIRLGNNGTSGPGSIIPIVSFDGDIEGIWFLGPTGMDDIKAHWPFNEGSGLTVTDTKNAKSGTLGSAPADPDWSAALPAPLDIAMSLKTRGFTFGQPQLPKTLSQSELRISYRDPDFTLDLLTDEVLQNKSIFTNRSYSTVKYKVQGKSDWVTSNTNDDHDDPFRENYAPLVLGAAGIILSSSGITLEQEAEQAEFFYDICTSSRFQFDLSNSKGTISVKGLTVGANFKDFAGERSMSR